MSRQERGWTAAWTTSPQRPSIGFAPNWSEEGFADQTVRQTVRLSVGGGALRVRLSNRYGTAPLQSGVDVAGAPGDGIVVLGDSLTDGTGSTPDTDHRFPDLLAQRLVAAGRPRAVLNQGIGGNRVTVDSAWLGDRATARFQHDVLTQPGVSTVIILAGINDIAIGEMAENSPFPVLAPYTQVSAQEVIAGHRDMIRRARAAGLRTVGATLLPMRGSGFSTARSEAERAAVNAWIRESQEYDAVIDLAQSMGDALDPAHDSGDHLHLNDAGYRAMAAAVNLTLL